jgi:Ca2+:H+ antiporter
MFMASVGLLDPSLLVSGGVVDSTTFVQDVSLAIAVILLLTYALGLLFSIKTHSEFFAGKTAEASAESEEKPWPMGFALPMLAGVTVCIALVSEIFVESVQVASGELGMSAPFVGFIVVALVGAAAEMTTAFAAARKNRLDLSVSISMGSAVQIALFVAPVTLILSYFIAPAPMDMVFWPGAVVMVLIATITAAFATNGGRSAWFVGVLLLAVFLIFATTLYLLPPRTG